MINSKGKTILVADTNVQDFPSAQRLVNVSKSCVRVARLFGFDPKVAFYPIQHLVTRYQKIQNMLETRLNC